MHIYRNSPTTVNQFSYAKTFYFGYKFLWSRCGLSGKIPEIFEDWLAIENIPEEEALAKISRMQTKIGLQYILVREGSEAILGAIQIHMYTLY